MSIYYFKPWKGKFFDFDNKIGHKFLIIEESFYNFSQKPESKDFVINTISEYLKNFSDSTECKEFDKVSTILSNIKPNISKEELWQSISYVSFSQLPQAHSLQDPDYFSDLQTFTSATNAFWNYLDELLPDGIIALGNRVQHLIPHNGYCISNEISIPKEVELRISDFTGDYKSKTIKCIQKDNYINGYYKFENYKSIGFLAAPHPQENLNSETFSQAVKVFNERISEFYSDN